MLKKKRFGVIPRMRNHRTKSNLRSIAPQYRKCLQLHTSTSSDVYVVHERVEFEFAYFMDIGTYYTREYARFDTLLIKILKINEDCTAVGKIGKCVRSSIHTTLSKDQRISLFCCTNNLSTVQPV